MGPITKRLLGTEAAGAPKVFLIRFQIDFIRLGHIDTPFSFNLTKDEVLDKDESSMAFLA